MNISIYKNIFDTKDGFNIKVDSALQRIKKGASKKSILAIRKEKDKDKRNKLKQNLPCVIFGGVFSERTKKGLIKSSGFAILDFDNIDVNYKEELKKDNYTYSCWVSPSGNGVKSLVRIPFVNSDIEYKDYYNALLARYEKANIDKSTKDISRVAYESYDPDIYVNVNSEIFTKKIEEPKYNSIPKNIKIEKYTDDETFDKLLKWINKTDSYISGNRNNYLFKLAAACNTFGLNKNNIINYFLSLFDLKNNEILNVVNSAYRNTSDFNTQSFESWDVLKSAQKMLRKSDRDVVKHKLIDENNINPSEADKIISKAVESNSRVVSTFWSVYFDKNNKAKFNFDLEKYINWLEGNGYFRFIVSGGEYILIYINDNIVSEVFRANIRKFIYDYINSLPFEFDGIFRSELLKWFFDNEKKFISENVFELLTEKVIDFHNDEQDNALFFYKNCVVKASIKGIETFDYSELEKSIWDKQILNREFKKIDYSEDNDFNVFIKNIFSANTDSIYTVIGYLLHQNKSLAFAPAIVLNDKIISDDPNGGTGKGIFAKAIGQFKSSVVIDGKSFSFDKSFAFQRVDLSTDLLVFDDVKRGFDFERLFSLITEGLVVEKKNKSEFFIPFEKSPKIIITTNYALKGDGNSIERRKIDFELEQYYTKDFTPLDEFGKLFFDGWDNEDWNVFDNFMLGCAILYFAKGIIKPKNINLQEKRLIANTNDSFIDFMKSFDSFNERLIKVDFHRIFVNETNLKSIKSNTLTKWVKRWCAYYNYEYKDVSYNSIRYFEINKKDV
jgi:hypothetical protein